MGLATIPMIWALWIAQPVTINQYDEVVYTHVPTAYFPTADECKEMQKFLAPNTHWSRCIGGHYILSK